MRRLAGQLTVRGDWTPRLREIDVVDIFPCIPHDVLRAALELFGIRVNYAPGISCSDRAFRGFLRGDGSAPFAILNAQGVRDRKTGRPMIGLGGADGKALGVKQLAAIGRLRGCVLLTLGEGLGSREMAGAFIRAGASAFIGLTGQAPTHMPDWESSRTLESEPRRSAPKLMFAIRLLYEIGWNGASVEEAWQRARNIDRATRRFQLWIPGPGGRPIAVKPQSKDVRNGLLMRGGATAQAGWKPPRLEVDVLAIRNWPADALRTERAVLEAFGMKVNWHYFWDLKELGQLLAGEKIHAPLVLLASHGSIVRRGEGGIVLRGGYRRKGIYHPPVLASHRWIARRIRLPGRVFISESCELGSPEIARSFLKGGMRAFIAASQSVETYSGFLFNWRFFYEIAVNCTTVQRAWRLARSPNGVTRLFQFYPKGKKIIVPTSSCRIVRAPALIEGFERTTANYFAEDWNRAYLDLDLQLGRAVPAPGNRPGLAFKLNFEFRKWKWPGISIELLPGGQRWVAARGVSFDAYVPYGIRLRRPVECLFSAVGSKRECLKDDLMLRQGWNHVRLPFNAAIWRYKERTAKRWRRGSVDIESVQPVIRIWLALDGRGRQEEGAVYFDNIRIY